MTYLMSVCPQDPAADDVARKRWCVHQHDTPSYVHVHPLGDLMDHLFDEDGDCICGPTPELIKDDEGDDAWMLTHHALDGREAHQ